MTEKKKFIPQKHRPAKVTGKDIVGYEKRPTPEEVFDTWIGQTLEPILGLKHPLLVAIELSQDEAVPYNSRIAAIKAVLPYVLAAPENTAAQLPQNNYTIHTTVTVVQPNEEKPALEHDQTPAQTALPTGVTSGMKIVK